MSTATCECGLPITTIANMTASEHKAAHVPEASLPWITFSSYMLPNVGRMLVQKRNGSSRTVRA